MVAFFKRPATEDAVDARIAVLSARRAQPIGSATAPAPTAVQGPAPAAAFDPARDASEQERLAAARDGLLLRLMSEINPERRRKLGRGELAKLVDAAVQEHLDLHGIDANPLARRDLVTAVIEGLLNPAKAAGARRAATRSTVDAAKAQIQPLILEHMDVAAAAEMPRAVFEAQLGGGSKTCLPKPRYS
jgi:hypothetical protein